MKKILFALLIGIFLILIGTIPVLINITNTSDNTNNDINTSPEEATLQPANIIGWTAYWDNENTLNRLNEMITGLSSFSPILYHATSTGGLEELASDGYKETIIELAEENELPIFPVIGDDFDYERVEALLYEQDTQEQFIEELIATAREEGYDGWEIDIETLREKDAEAFSDFVVNVSSGLHENGLRLHMILYAKDENETYAPALVQDYEVIGNAADEVRLMTYGFHNESTDAGGQAPLPWYRSVLSYALDKIPEEKIAIGITTHGYDWGPSQTEALTYQQVASRIEEYDAQVRYDESVSSAIATYTSNGQQHEIWFEDTKTITEKVKIAQNEFGINKFAIWRVGAEDTGIWNEIEAQ